MKEYWVAAELTKLKGKVKEAHSRANCVIKQAKKEKMKTLAKSKIDRKENRVYNLIDNVDVSISNKVKSEELAVFVESVRGLLNSEAHILDAEIDDLAMLDPELASRVEKLRCAASASAMKAMNSVRKYRNEDGAASKCSAGSFVPRSKAAAGSATEDRAASNAPPPKSDAQKSRDASEPLFAKKKSTTGKERRRREPSPPSDEDDSSGVEEDNKSSSEDAEGYNRDRRQYNEDRRRWQENAQGNPPIYDPEEPPGGGGGGAGQGDGGGQPPPPPRGDGDPPRGQHRQVGIIDGDVQGAVIVEVLSALAKRFEKPSQPPPPPIPTFKDSYKDYPRFRADLRAYLKEFYSTAPERVRVMTIHEKCFTKATLAKIGHLDTVKEIFATLSKTYVRTDRYLEEILLQIRKMCPIDENDHVGLETFYVHILALCVEARALNMFHHVANPLVTAMFVDHFPLS